MTTLCEQCISLVFDEAINRKHKKIVCKRIWFILNVCHLDFKYEIDATIGCAEVKFNMTILHWTYLQQNRQSLS